MKWIARIAIVFLLTASVLLLAQGATPQVENTEQWSLLFVQTADGGSLTAVDDGTFRLVLNDVSPILWFTDRPERQAGHATTADFVQMWSESDDSFAADPPNAVLEIGQNDYAIELSNPVYDEAANTLTYIVMTLTDPVGVTVGEPAALAAMTFDTAALFIDGLWDDIKDFLTATLSPADCHMDLLSDDCDQ